MDMRPKVYFTIHRQNSMPIVKEALLDTTQVVYSGINVSEYAKVQIRLSSPHDPNATLKVETYQTEEVIEIRQSDGDVTIMAGENTEHMLVPGQYPFETCFNGTKYFSYYNVFSKSFSSESLLNLRQYLEKLLKGLSYDLVKQRLGMATPVSDINPTLLQLFQFVNKHKNHIRRNFEMIIKEPITDLISEYRITHKIQKPNQKSFRWYAQKGGQRNYSPLAPTQHYEKHAQMTLLNIENQWVRYIINYFLQAIRKLEVNFQKEIMSISNKLEHQQKLLKQNEKQMRLGPNSFGYTKTLRTLKGKRELINSRIKELKNEKYSYLSYKQQLHETMYIFTDLENASWIQSLPTQKPKKVTQRILKDHRYRRLYTLYKELLRLETKHVESKIPGIQFRRTWQLFEYYNVGILIDILRENGYNWVDGWLARKDSPHLHIGTLPQDTTLKFEKPDSDYYIELAYDKELESSIVDLSYSRYFNSDGRRPDILLTIYKRDGKLYSGKAGLIIESKCRHHRYLINEEIEPDIKSQLKDFKKLEYFDADNLEDPVKTPIKQVIVLYPKQNGRDPVIADHVYGETILYIQLEPNDPSSDTKPFGYHILKENIDNFLSQIEEGRVYA